MTGKRPNMSIPAGEVVADRCSLFKAAFLPATFRHPTAGRSACPWALGSPRRRCEPCHRTTIPTAHKVYSTAADNQPPLKLRPPRRARDSSDNRALVSSTCGIPACSARYPQIEVTFDIDANGILKVPLGQGNRQVPGDAPFLAPPLCPTGS